MNGGADILAAILATALVAGILWLLLPEERLIDAFFDTVDDAPLSQRSARRSPGTTARPVPELELLQRLRERGL